MGNFYKLFPLKQEKSDLKKKGRKPWERLGFRSFLCLKDEWCIYPCIIYSVWLILDNKKSADCRVGISSQIFSQKYYFQLHNGQVLLCCSYPFFLGQYWWRRNPRRIFFLSRMWWSWRMWRRMPLWRLKRKSSRSTRSDPKWSWLKHTIIIFLC